MKCLYLCLYLFLAVTGAALAQPNSTLRGEITGGSRDQHLYVEALDATRRQVLDRAAVNQDGSFTIRADATQLNHADYRVTDQWGNELHHEAVTSGIRAPIEIRLRPEAPAAQPGGMVSAYALSHAVPSKAQKEFRKALRFSSNQDPEHAMASLRKAVEIDPGFVQAHINIGATLMGLKRNEEARAEFEAAVRLDPSCVMAHADLAVASLSLHRFEDAEAHARRALTLDPAYVKARFTLGLALAGTPGREKEALPYLAQSAGEFPNAHLAAAHIHTAGGRRAEAIRELEAYRAIPGGTQREAADKWIANLRGK